MNFKISSSRSAALRGSTASFGLRHCVMMRRHDMGKTGRKGQKRVMVSSDHFTLLVFFDFFI